MAPLHLLRIRRPKQSRRCVGKDICLFTGPGTNISSKYKCNIESNRIDGIPDYYYYTIYLLVRRTYIQSYNGNFVNTLVYLCEVDL